MKSNISYENKLLMYSIIKAIQPFLSEGEFIIVREPFRWKDTRDEVHVEGKSCPDYGVISNAYEMFSSQSVAESIGCDLVEDFGNLAIVKKYG